MSKKKTETENVEGVKVRVNKSELIRNYCKKNKKAGPTEAAAALTEETGISFTPQMISLALYNAKKKLRAKTGRPKGKVAKKTTVVKNTLNSDVMLLAADFVSKVGDIEVAQNAVDLLVKLRG